MVRSPADNARVHPDAKGDPYVAQEDGAVVIFAGARTRARYARNA
jgi:hypothetical protein